MNKQTKITRRKFLIGTGAVVGTSVVACSGLGILATAQPAVEFSQSSCIKERNMTQKILVTYASRAGTTDEVAESISQVLCDAGASVDVRPVKDVTDLSPYSAVILGSAIYMGGWMSDATKFVEKHRELLSQMPVATFTVCMLMVDNPAQHQQLIAAHFTESEQQPHIQPVSNGLFAGRIDYGKLPFLHKTIAKMMKAEEQDARDWDAIRAWSGTLLPQIVPTV